MRKHVLSTGCTAASSSPGSSSSNTADKYAAYTVEKAKRSGATDAQIAVQMQQMTRFKEMYGNPLVNVALTLLEPLPVGIFFTLVTAGVLSRKRRAKGAADAPVQGQHC